MGTLKFQVVQSTSPFTRLDFRTKLVMMGVITLMAFIWESPIAGGLLTLSVALGCLAFGVNRTYLVTIFAVMLPFNLFLLISMGFFNVDQVKLLTGKTDLTPLLSLPAQGWLGGASLSWEGLLYGLNIAFKTLTMVLVIPLGVFTTDVNQMIVSLARLKIDYKVIFIFSSTLRFVPLLLEEGKLIMEAQRLRGLDFAQMGWLTRGQIYAKMAIPLILNALTKSQKLDIVLQSKAFSGSSQRTYLHESLLTPIDYVLIVGCALLLVGAIGLYIGFGVGKFAWLI
jgi:energy-coupling factor transport system permease protein